jgi:hypothetical protein
VILYRYFIVFVLSLILMPKQAGAELLTYSYSGWTNAALIEGEIPPGLDEIVTDPATPFDLEFTYDTVGLLENSDSGWATYAAGPVSATFHVTGKKVVFSSSASHLKVVDGVEDQFLIEYSQLDGPEVKIVEDGSTDLTLPYVSYFFSLTFTEDEGLAFSDTSLPPSFQPGAFDTDNEGVLSIGVFNFGPDWSKNIGGIVDVSDAQAVPAPAAIWLLGGALACLPGLRRRGSFLGAE